MSSEAFHAVCLQRRGRIQKAARPGCPRATEACGLYRSFDLISQRVVQAGKRANDCLLKNKFAIRRMGTLARPAFANPTWMAQGRTGKSAHPTGLDLQLFLLHRRKRARRGAEGREVLHSTEQV